MTTSEYSRLTDGFEPIDMPQRDVRLAMLANGYPSIPLHGKVPIPERWQSRAITKEVIDDWGNLGPNTGMPTKDTSVFDIDISHERGAQIAAAVVRLYLEDKGQILERINNPPRRAFLMRSTKPFKKIVRKIAEPDGAVHQIEVLGDGQQLAVAGEPIVWRDGKSPINVPRDQLPLVDEEEVRAILDLCIGELKDKLGWVEFIDGSAPNKNFVADQGPADGLRQPTIDQRLEGMTPGVDVNDALWRAVGSRLQSGAPMDEVVAELVQKGMDVAPSENWTAEEQRIEIEHMCLRTILKDSKLEVLLSHRYRQQLERLRADGYETFTASKNRYGPYIRPSGAKDEQGAASEALHVADGERKLRFRLIKFQDMRPGLEPAYLVDELIPSTGLVLVWGKQKTFKSFWLLDLFVHVAMGWPYRDHAVRQGPVIYCAFEGGHGYKGRIEAIRRHYGINDDLDVPLYVMPGQVDLIADGKALVDEFRYQLGNVVPAVVVLDTLNRSLSGSESSDKDMTLYVKAAEAVRKAFGCLCVIVHHCGYDDTHARGHTSLPAAVDAELSVIRDEGSPIVLVTVKAMRDGPEGMIVRSGAKPLPLDPDQNGKPRSSIVITADDDQTIVMPSKHGGRRDTATPLLLEILRAAIDTKGEYFTPDGKVPLQAVDQEHVREIFYRRYVNAEEDKKRSQGAQTHAYRRAIDNGVARKIVSGQKDDQGRQMLWFTRDEATPL